MNFLLSPSKPFISTLRRVDKTIGGNFKRAGFNGLGGGCPTNHDDMQEDSQKPITI
ncbi:MAG: hypothetical protein V3S97_04105 [Candidatus Bathyarchaeia archaeon]